MSEQYEKAREDDAGVNPYEAAGRLRGIREALEAVKNADFSRDEYAYDACVEAVEALLPKD